jgi:uncharacterized protein YdeI (BOF family)
MPQKSLFLPLLLSLALVGSIFAANANPPPVPPAGAPADERHFDRVADVKRGDRVLLRGEVVRILDEDEFLLADDTGRIRVYIGWKNDLPVGRGDQVIVEGRADDDTLFGMRPEIYARVLELANGERIVLTR